MFLTACPSPTSPSIGTTSATLADYKVTAVGPRTDADGNALPADAQPFGAAVATPVLRQQIYLGGPTYSGAESNLIDYAGNTATMVRQLADDSKTSWTAHAHASVGARLDTKGKQTVVSAVFMPTSPAGTAISAGVKTTGTVKIVTWNGTEQTILTPFKSGTSEKAFDVYMPGWAGAPYSALSMAAGDVDDDGKDEIALCVGNYFVILDDNLSTLLHSSWATNDGAANTDLYTFHPSLVAAGDIMNDGTTAFVVTYGSNTTGYTGLYKVFAGSTPAQIATGSISNSASKLNYASVAFGDIDGDGSQDLLFAGLDDGGYCRLLAGEWNGSQNNITWSSKRYDVPGMQAAYWMDRPVAPLVAFNPNGKGSIARDIVMVWNSIVTYDASAGFTRGYGDLSTIEVPLYANAAAADVNLDNKEELITISGESDYAFIYSLNISDKFGAPTTIPITRTMASTLAVADVLGKSLSLQYVSQAVRYANPQIVATLASPPYYAGATGNASFGNGGTTLSFTNDSSEDINNSITVKAGVTFGSDVEVPLLGSDAGAARDTLTIEAAFTVGFSITETRSVTHAWTTMAGEDSVLYSCIPYDVYSYKVLSAPNTDSIGDIITIEFPRSPQIITMDRDRFNRLPGNPISVGSSVFGHTLGQPTSYPSKIAMASACSASDTSMYDKSDGVSATSGDNYSSDTISYGSSKATSIGAGVSVTYEAEAVAAGVVFGVSVGLETDTSYTVSTGSSTQISGTVPSISDGDPGFKYGIGMYRFEDAAVQPNPFLVVTYWVGN